VFNHGRTAGVMMDCELFEALLTRLDELEDALLLEEARWRLAAPGGEALSDFDVRGERANLAPVLEPFDGWE
jgi:hypothetical protein